jgi:2-dehydro-3-deoxyglucarate aldolase/4-hydroxy-2-oxoheptanedioate aldolase
MPARIKELLASGKLVRIFNLGQHVSPKLVEMVAIHGGFDAFWLDHEHGGMTLEATEHTARAIRAAGLDSFVRMAPTDYATMMRFLEVGVGGIMAATIRTAAEAEQVVRWVKFAPRGHRGMNGANVDGRYGTIPMAEYAERANRETFVSVQIETAEAVENIDAIAAVADVDLLFVGPADLSQSLGVTGQFTHPRCLEAIDRIAAACRNAGKTWGIVPIGPEYAQRMVERGCRMFVIGSDVGAFHRGIEASKGLYPSFFPPGDAPPDAPATYAGR